MSGVRKCTGPTFRLGGLFSLASPISLPTFTLWWRLQEHLLFDAEKIIRWTFEVARVSGRSALSICNDRWMGSAQSTQW